jgi:hypothetical protein
MDVRKAVPEPLLQANGRRDSRADELVRAQLREHVGLEEEAVRLPAQEIVGPEDREEWKPLEDDASKPAAHVREREGEEAEEDPHYETIS